MHDTSFWRETIIPKAAGSLRAASTVHSLGLLKIGLPRRDLPERFGSWKSVHNRFTKWVQKDNWQTIFNALPYKTDENSTIVDGSVAQMH